MYTAGPKALFQCVLSVLFITNIKLYLPFTQVTYNQTYHPLYHPTVKALNELGIPTNYTPVRVHYGMCFAI
jgi:hypothetical protein